MISTEQYFEVFKDAFDSYKEFYLSNRYSDSKESNISLVTGDIFNYMMCTGQFYLGFDDGMFFNDDQNGTTITILSGENSNTYTYKKQIFLDPSNPKPKIRLHYRDNDNISKRELFDFSQENIFQQSLIHSIDYNDVNFDYELHIMCMDYLKFNNNRIEDIIVQFRIENYFDYDFYKSNSKRILTNEI